MSEIFNEKCELALWLNAFNNSKPEFNLDILIKKSLFYPSSGTDSSIIDFYKDSHQSFIYSDFSISQNILNENLITSLQKKYDLIYEQEINEEIPNMPDKQAILDHIKDHQPNWSQEQVIVEPFIKWFIFKDRQNQSKDSKPNIFSLLYVCNESILSYINIYSNKISPKTIVLKHAGAGFGYNYTHFEDPNDLLFSIFERFNKFPDLIISDKTLELPFYNFAKESIIQDEYNGNKDLTMYLYQSNK